jgi:hypothetical protein
MSKPILLSMIKRFPDIMMDAGPLKSQRKKVLDRIMIMTARTGPDRILTALLETLFPGCGIDVICKPSGAEEASIFPFEGDITLPEQGENHGNNSRRG